MAQNMLKGFTKVSAITVLAFGQLALAANVAETSSGVDPQAQARNSENSELSNVSRLPKVHIDGSYFVRDGKRFFPMGAHWVPAKAAMQWPVLWDPKDIEADFAKMHELGYSLVRFDMLWAWFEPRPGDYNPTAFEQLDFLISLAHRYQIWLLSRKCN